MGRHSGSAAVVTRRSQPPAASMASSVPSPPSASGERRTSSSGRARRQPSASARATCTELSVPLNESGAKSTRSGRARSAWPRDSTPILSAADTAAIGRRTGTSAGSMPAAASCSGARRAWNKPRSALTMLRLTIPGLQDPPADAPGAPRESPACHGPSSSLPQARSAPDERVERGDALGGGLAALEVLRDPDHRRAFEVGELLDLERQAAPAGAGELHRGSELGEQPDLAALLHPLHDGLEDHERHSG